MSEAISSPARQRAPSKHSRLAEPKSPRGSSIVVGDARATITAREQGGLRAYELASTGPLRDDWSSEGQVAFSEEAGHARIRTGNLLFDGLYAMAISEALANCESEVSDENYNHGAPVRLDAFRTGESWSYVWTRDLSYSLHLALASFDPARAVQSLLFKASELKPAIPGRLRHQIVQDTGSGGGYPVSTDRVIWALGVHETLKCLAGQEREDFLRSIYPTLCNTIEQDRVLVFDPSDGLYRGEHSFLDWREQSYPAWTRDNVVAIAMSKSTSVNAANYFLLRRAAEYSELLDRPSLKARYDAWADALRDEINARLFDPQAGLYRTYLLSDSGYDIPVSRYDLLGQSLAILFGVADPAQGEAIIRNYPTGPHGPPVIWPQERNVPIYHNQGIWPFVTAYWIKAARQVGHSAAVDLGMDSLRRSAALNLSNIENFDFVSGRAQATSGPRHGPVVNSRRQLWSVAGYLSMVQDVVFGLEISWRGLRFTPFVTAQLRNTIFAGVGAIELRNFSHLGTRNDVVVHLPPAGSRGAGAIGRVLFNGQPVDRDFVDADRLMDRNLWEIWLEPPRGEAIDPAPVRMVDVHDEHAICGPVQPAWSPGLSLEGGRLTLAYCHEDPSSVAFNIYRDGERCATGLRETKWTDPSSLDHDSRISTYAVEAVDVFSGNSSHLTPAATHRGDGQIFTIQAAAMKNRGGKLVGGHHFEYWGKPSHRLTTPAFCPRRSGYYLLQAEYSNGAGPVSTGLTCAVKKIALYRAGKRQPESAGYLIMPHSDDWARWVLSSPVKAFLDAGEEYHFVIAEDEYCRNMSYLKNNERYTIGAGGGTESYNCANLAALHILYLNNGQGNR